MPVAIRLHHPPNRVLGNGVAVVDKFRTRRPSLAAFAVKACTSSCLWLKHGKWLE
ncbi:hypothetical protein [Vibrio hepatarius]|uniref:hypothetical protein n=1 Tax=Vibrio hepatarius TaxID=171383 RepID=UPI001C080EF2|nr:hypothetical protein [Vibrio hepatarius]MBU2895475.1 hypothetical protein [Vibrio hepatarius]